jgi:hypothetical protein
LRVEVRFYGFVRDVIANTAFSLEIPAGSNLRDLLSESIKNSSERLRDRLFTSSGDLETDVQIFVVATQTPSLEEVVADGLESSDVKIFSLSDSWRMSSWIARWLKRTYGFRRPAAFATRYIFLFKPAQKKLPSSSFRCGFSSFVHLKGPVYLFGSRTFCFTQHFGNLTDQQLFRPFQSLTVVWR